MANTICIGQIEVDLTMRVLRRSGQEVRVGTRAFDILEALLEANGSVVTKNELISRVWPTTVVEENNLNVHISAIRKLLRDTPVRIRTVPGRGFRLLISESDNVERRTQVAHDVSPLITNLPALGSALIGRDNAIVSVGKVLAQWRLLTLVGSGGIGKTRLAIEAARAVRSSFPQGVFLVCLATVTDSEGVLAAIAKVIGMHARKDNFQESLEHLVGAINVCKILFILDNCEHVLVPVAAVAQALIQGCQDVHIIATSREALRIVDENLFNVPPLRYPEPSAFRHSIVSCSAVDLFIYRVRAVDPQFVPDDTEVSAIGTICRRLDGIPLAIELAAARAAALGVTALASHLDDRFSVLTGGHRTALPRHQTLRATLDWSYELLGEDERTLLRRLAMFANGFTIDDACAISTEAGLATGEVLEAVAGLFSKSLIAVRRDQAQKRYGLLETTRAYFLQKLEDYGETHDAAREHAKYFTARLTLAQGHGKLACLRDKIDDIRSALAWAFSLKGDKFVGVELATVAVHFFFEMSHLEESYIWATRALGAEHALQPRTTKRARQRASLLSVLGASMVTCPLRGAH